MGADQTGVTVGKESEGGSNLDGCYKGEFDPPVVGNGRSGETE